MTTPEQRIQELESSRGPQHSRIFVVYEGEPEPDRSDSSAWERTSPLQLPDRTIEVYYPKSSIADGVLMTYQQAEQEKPQ